MTPPMFVLWHYFQFGTSYKPDGLGRGSGGRNSHLEGGQAVETWIVLNVSRCDVETRPVPRTSNMALGQNTWRKQPQLMTPALTLGKTLLHCCDYTPWQASWNTQPLFLDTWILHTMRLLWGCFSEHCIRMILTTSPRYSSVRYRSYCVHILFLRCNVPPTKCYC